MATVVLTKTEGYTQDDIGKAVSSALDALNYSLNNDIDRVVIKPNLCYYWDYSTGATTDPRVVSAVIDWTREKLGQDVSIVVAEADASAMRTKHSFKMLGYDQLCRKKNVKLVNLSEGKIVDTEVTVAGEDFVLPVNKMLLDADLMINVPKMKYQRVVGFTCALKNMFGAVAKPRKYVYHSRLTHAIVGINMIVRTSIALVDGIVVAGKTPKKLGVIIAGDDALATDFVAAKAVGFNPSRISYLKLAGEEKIGDIDGIDLIENRVRLEEIEREFPKQSHLLQKFSWTLQLKILRLYSKMAGDVIPPILDDDV